VNSQVWWFVARSSGIIAWGLLTLAVVWGLLLSTRVSAARLAARRLRPAWLLDLHRHLGALAVTFTMLHILGIVADSYVTFSWSDVLVPMASDWKPGPVAFGVVSMYLLVAIEATSLAMRYLPRPLWRWVHRTSFLLYAMATWHGISAGTDAGNIWFRIASWVSIVVVAGLTIRLVIVSRCRLTAPARSAAGELPPSGVTGPPAPVAALPPPVLASPVLVGAGGLPPPPPPMPARLQEVRRGLPSPPPG
jgi:predicted ferric reductase